MRRIKGFDDFSFFLCFLCLGDAKEGSVEEEEEELT